LKFTESSHFLQIEVLIRSSYCMRKVQPYRFVPQTSYYGRAIRPMVSGSGFPPPEPLFSSALFPSLRMAGRIVQLKVVMAGLDPWAFSPRAGSVGIHVLATGTGGAGSRVNARVEPAHDDLRSAPIETQPLYRTALSRRGEREGPAVSAAGR